MTAHFEETEGQVIRLKTIFVHLGKKPTGKHCDGTEGCLMEVAEAVKDEEGALKDAGIIGASLRVEHYKIAGYSAAIAMAKALKEEEVVKLPTESLHEEQAAAKNIPSICSHLDSEASGVSIEQADDEGEDNEPAADEEESQKKSEEDEAAAAPSLVQQASTSETGEPKKKPKSSK